MKITLSVTERVNVGSYEFIEISGGVEFDEDEAFDNGVDAATYAKDQLDVLLRSHRRRALDVLPEESESFLTYHPALTQEK